MKKLLAGVTTLVTVSTTGCFGCFGLGTVSADDTPPPGASTAGPPATPSDGTAYALGGAHVLGIPYDEYIRREGADWFPGLKRLNIGYPAGQVQGHLLERLFPGIGQLDQAFPGAGLDGPSVGESIEEGANNLDAAIRTGGRGVAIGLSEGCLVLDAEQARLANDPTAPPRDQLSFATFGDPIARTPFGQSFLTAMFPVGDVAPVLDYRVPPPFESQYDTKVFVSAYDSIADFPDRPDNLFAFGNALMGLATGHTAVAFTGPNMVPPQNIRTTVNSKGATTTTYLIPEKHLPLVMPLTYIGIPEDTLNKLDAILAPRVNAGYARNDDPSTAPIQVDAVHGFDPLAITTPANEATFGGGDPISQMLNSAGAAFSHPAG